MPESRHEVTTEGGLDVAAQTARVADACTALGAAGIRVSLFIDPDAAQIEAAQRAGAPVVELHTGAYAGCRRARRGPSSSSGCARRRGSPPRSGLTVNAGHGLHYHNVAADRGDSAKSSS